MKAITVMLGTSSVHLLTGKAQGRSQGCYTPKIEADEVVHFVGDKKLLVTSTFFEGMFEKLVNRVQGRKMVDVLNVSKLSPLSQKEFHKAIRKGGY